MTLATSLIILALSETKQNGFSVLKTFSRKNCSSTCDNRSTVKNQGSLLRTFSRFLVMLSYSKTPDGFSGQKQKFMASTTKQQAEICSQVYCLGSSTCQSLHLSYARPEAEIFSRSWPKKLSIFEGLILQKVQTSTTFLQVSRTF